MSTYPHKILPIIHPSVVANLLEEKDCIVADCRPKSRYLENHLTGAIYVDLDTHLADIPENPANGGRHPLPSFNHFVQILGELGINENNHLLLYDEHSGANYAARFWWMLRAIGHEYVQVIDGGYKGIITAQLPTTAETRKLSPTKYTCNHSTWQLPSINLSELDKIVEQRSEKIIDVRDRNRYLGISEPIDLVAGHIPGAINLPFSENLKEDGYFLSAEELHKKYKDFSSSTVVHCGSGVTACHTLLAMDYAKLPIPNLYVGSWSEWSRNNRQIATG
jgi:3-mercaptopyruvate sulfurtransferase SseA